jgi:hypothetical protein
METLDLIENAYFERPDPEPRTFCHLSLRRRLDGSYVVESVDGTLDAFGNRSGTISVLLDGATLDDAQSTYEALISARLAAGFERR